MASIKSSQKMPRLIVNGLLSLVLFASPVFAQNSASDSVLSQPTTQAPEFGPKPDTEMLLVCDGSTFTVAPTSQTNALVTDNSGYMASGSVTSSRPTSVGFQVRLRIIGGDAEMNIPAIAAPTISTGNGGWYKVKDLKIGENEISGKIKMNWFNSSIFRIDRRTGQITSEGGFSGTCRKENLEKRAF